MRQVATRLGSLECQIVQPADGSKPSQIAIFCHGYGAPGDDLVSFAEELARVDGRLGQGWWYVFPQAPLQLQPGYDSRAWWQIDIMRMSEAFMTGKLDVLMNDVPSGLPAARRALHGALDQLLVQTGLPMSRVVLGGFSQGSMLATDLSLRLEEAPAGLCVLSGALIAVPEWSPKTAMRAGLPVFQSHGTHDQVLPYPVGEALRQFLETGGLSVEFVPFRGAHGVDRMVLTKLAAWLVARGEHMA